MKAWHWLNEDGRLAYGTRRLVKPGVKMSCKGPIVPCKNGMHASVRIIDALDYAPGPIICRVEVGGKIVESTDRLAARWRRVEWMFDATEVLHRFACKVAERALRDANVEDERCYEAIRVKLRWLEGNATDAELAAAWAAAWAAARAAQDEILTDMIEAEARKRGLR